MSPAIANLINSSTNSKVISSSMMDSTEFLKVKESDILNDDDCSEFSSPIRTADAGAKLVQSRLQRASYKAHSTTPSTRSVQSNSLSGQGASQLFAQNRAASALPPGKRNSIGNHQMNGAALASKSQQQKIHQIEDALASVLDDMKQLDFSTDMNKVPMIPPIGLGIPNHLKSSQNALKTAVNCSTNSTGCHSSASSTSSASSGSTSSQNGGAKEHRLKSNLSSEDYLSSGENSGGEEVVGHSNGLGHKLSEPLVKSTVDEAAFTNGHKVVNNFKASSGSINRRPDLVLDLPLNLLFTSPLPAQSQPANLEQSPLTNTLTSTPSSLTQSVNARQSKIMQQTLPHVKTRRLSADRTNGTSNLNLNGGKAVSNSGASLPISQVLSNGLARENLHSSSTSSTESSSMSTSAVSSASSAANGAAAPRTNNLLLTCAAAAAAAANTAVLANNSLTSNGGNQFPVPPIQTLQNSSASLSADSLPIRTFNVDFICTNPAPENGTVENGAGSSVAKHHAAGKIVSLPMPHVPVVSMSATVVVQNEASQSSFASNKKPELNESGNSESNVSTVASTIAKIEEDIKGEKVKAVKKQPPPLMKKPEKSEEILRKLGKSPPQGEANHDSANGQTSMCTSPTNSMASCSSINLFSSSSQTATNGTSNLSIRLSNSKATDV